jgi:hypothetical protein
VVVLLIALIANGSFSGSENSGGSQNNPDQDTSLPDPSLPDNGLGDGDPDELEPTENGARSPNGAVEYTINDFACVDNIPGRSRISGGLYCVADLDLENLSGSEITFSSSEQRLVTTNDERVGAETPSAVEQNADLWSPIEAGQRVRGDLVFSIRTSQEAAQLLLTHAPDEQATAIDVFEDSSD